MPLADKRVANILGDVIAAEGEVTLIISLLITTVGNFLYIFNFAGQKDPKTLVRQPL